jgi:hypothetical protein
MRVAALTLAALLLTAAPAPASPIGALDEADQAAVEALALYDEATARRALQAVTEADVLSDLVRQQERSRDRFRQLLSPYERDVQEQLFEVSRYPELIAQIVDAGPKSPDELEAVAAPYPEEVRVAALAAASRHWKVVARIDALLRDETAWLEARIADLPDEKRAAFRALVATPDLLALLAENATLAVLLGDAYEREPEAVVSWLAGLREEAAEESAEDAREFAREVEDDPELAGEIEAATIRYEQETGHSAYQPATVRHLHIHLRPYSYWIGYPWWYDAHYVHYAPWYYWYPRVHWAFGSFYFGPRLRASFRVPHGAFWGWYFHRPIHHHRYPRVTHHVVRHHDRHRAHHHRHFRHRRHRVRHRHVAAHAVYHFRRKAERFVPREFPRSHRVDRIREHWRLRGDWERERRVPRRREMRVERRRDRSEVRRARRREASVRERVRPRREVRAERGRDREKVRRAKRREARAVQRAPDSGKMEPKRSRRLRSERAQPQREVKAERRRDRAKARRAQPQMRQIAAEDRRAAKRTHARRGRSRRAAP